MSAKAGDVEVGLFNARGHAGGGPAALHIDHDQRQLRHDGVTQRLGLQRNARAAGTRDRHAPGVTRAERHRNGGNFIFALNKGPAVFGQLASQQFHNVRPGGDWITGAKTNTGSDQAVTERFVAGHDDLMAGPFLAFDESECFQDVVERVAVTRMESGQGIVQDALILAAKAFADELFELGHIQVEHFRDQPEDKHVLALVFAGAADGFHGQ